MVGGDPSGWRHGLGVLITAGMVAWITAWATADVGAEGDEAPAATSQTDSSLATSTTWSLPTPQRQGGLLPLACESFPPAVTTEIVKVLTQLTLPHTRPTHHEQEAVPP